MTSMEQERAIGSTLQPYTEQQRVVGSTLQGLLWNTSEEIMNASSPGNIFNLDTSTTDAVTVSIWDGFMGDMNTSISHTTELSISSGSLEYPNDESSVKILVYSIVLITILSIGLLCNALSFFVMIRKNTRSTRMAVFLLPLAIFDEIRLIAEYLYFLPGYGKLPFVCPVIIWTIGSSGMVSAWLLVLMTAERATSVYSPITFKSNWSKKMSVMMVVATLVTCPLINLGWVLSAELEIDPLSDTLVCVSVPQRTELLIFSVVLSLFYMILPSMALIVLNTVIVKGIYTHVDRAVSDEDVARNKKNKQLTLTVLSISVFFLISMVPAGVYEIYYMTPYADKVNNLWDVIAILLCLNSAVNFFFYIIGGTRFRKEFVNMMCCACHKIQNSE